jgi:hypothetical protein
LASAVGTARIAITRGAQWDDKWGRGGGHFAHLSRLWRRRTHLRARTGGYRSAHATPSDDIVSGKISVRVRVREGLLKGRAANKNAAMQNKTVNCLDVLRGVCIRRFFFGMETKERVVWPHQDWRQLCAALGRARFQMTEKKKEPTCAGVESGTVS